MALVLKLPNGFPIEHIPAAQGVVQLAAEHDWNTLNNVPVCIDRYGQVTARFGQQVWDCSPFSADKGSDKSARKFDFHLLADSPGLLLQAKLICYGWLYQVGHQSGRQCKLGALAPRFNNYLKKIMFFLHQQGKDDLSALNESEVWEQWEQHLAESKSGFRHIVSTLTTLSAVARLDNWLPFRLTLPVRDFTQLAVKLAADGKIQSNQTLAIPETLVDILYGEAVKLVEQAWPHRVALAQLERNLQANYDAGKTAVDHKIATKQLPHLHDTNGQLNTHYYANAINRNAPQSSTAIIIATLTETKLLPEKPADGNWFSEWSSQLRTACFICCSAFSGMRVSEVFELCQDSFYTHKINDQIFHVVRAATHKLAAGKKREEWLCSPVVEKAIELAVALSASQREQLRLLAQHSNNPAHADTLREMSDCLWLSQAHRSKQPTVIPRSAWSSRLQQFAKNVGAVVDGTTLAECLRMNPQSRGMIEAKVKIGQSWPLATHQFRRTFACFAVRHHLGHPIAIKQQFKHLYVRMSEWYSNGAVEARLNDVQVDNEITRLLNDASIEHTTASYDRWFNSDEPLSGSFGKAIIAMRANKPVIYSSWDNLYRLVKEKRLTLHGTLHSYCKNGYDCDMDGVENPAFCIECTGSVIDTKQAQWWQQTHARLTTYLREQANASLGEYAHCITQIRAAEKVMHDHHIDYQPYQHPIEVLNL